jgi:acyl-CoA synthetase
MAGATIPREVAQRFLDLGIKPQNVYGMTENGSHQYTLPSDDNNTIVSTCGRACKGYEIKIFNAENPDIEVGTGETGEIGGRGGVLTLGYYDNQDATEKSFNSSGWFLSGDLGMLDENGCLHVVGRKKDLIIRGGHNIYPSRIEDLAHRHPNILKSAAFAVPDDRLGEKVCLAVIFASGTSMSANEVLQHLHDAGLSKYDMPEYFIAMDAFPLTPSGKILKREMIEWLKDGRLVPAPVRWKAEAKSDNEGVSA